MQCCSLLVGDIRQVNKWFALVAYPKVITEICESDPGQFFEDPLNRDIGLVREFVYALLNRGLNMNIS